MHTIVRGMHTFTDARASRRRLLRRVNSQQNRWHGRGSMHVWAEEKPHAGISCTGTFTVLAMTSYPEVCIASRAARSMQSLRATPVCQRIAWVQNNSSLVAGECGSGTGPKNGTIDNESSLDNERRYYQRGLPACCGNAGSRGAGGAFQIREQQNTFAMDATILITYH